MLELLIDKCGLIMILMLNWFECYNVLVLLLLVVLLSVVVEFKEDFGQCVLVIMGVGDKVFCLGVDFKLMCERQVSVGEEG